MNEDQANHEDHRDVAASESSQIWGGNILDSSSTLIEMSPQLDGRDNDHNSESDNLSRRSMGRHSTQSIGSHGRHSHRSQNRYYQQSLASPAMSRLTSIVSQSTMIEPSVNELGVLVGCWTS